MNCKDCLFGKQETYIRDEVLRCTVAVYAGDVDMSTESTDPFDDTLSYPSDYGQYSAQMFVGRNFGCVKFKPKDSILEDSQS